MEADEVVEFEVTVLEEAEDSDEVAVLVPVDDAELSEVVETVPVDDSVDPVPDVEMLIDIEVFLLLSLLSSSPSSPELPSAAAPPAAAPPDAAPASPPASPPRPPRMPTPAAPIPPPPSVFPLDVEEDVDDDEADVEVLEPWSLTDEDVDREVEAKILVPECDVKDEEFAGDEKDEDDELATLSEVEDEKLRAVLVALMLPGNADVNEDGDDEEEGKFGWLDEALTTVDDD